MALVFKSINCLFLFAFSADPEAINTVSTRLMLTLLSGTRSSV